MNKNPRKLLLASSVVIAMTIATGSAVAATPSQDVINDARQESQIWTTYELSPYLRDNNLKVSVRNGKATLTGTVEEGASKDLARQIALGVTGIKEVDNQIVVQANYVAPQVSADRSSYRQVIDDASVTAAVTSKLAWSKYTDGLSTQIDTKAGKVTLQGSADTAAVKELAGQLAMNTRGVVAVDNQLVIGGPKPTVLKTVKNSTQAAAQDVSDAWITTKVKSTFRYSSNVEGANINVSTTGGVVTLSGKVDSKAESALAVELARNVRGVKSVQSQGLVL